jgi:hypothetical protein
MSRASGWWRFAGRALVTALVVVGAAGCLVVPVPVPEPAYGPPPGYVVRPPVVVAPVPVPVYPHYGYGGYRYRRGW